MRRKGKGYWSGSVATYARQLHENLIDYRAVLERIGSRQLTRGHDCRSYFLALLVSTSRLYMDWLTITTMEREWGEGDTPHTERRDARAFTREAAMRKKVGEKLGTLRCWQAFDPMNYFADENLLRCRQDYVNCLALHLPEIYGEAIRLEADVQEIAGGAKLTPQRLSVLVVGLAHLAHHASRWRWSARPWLKIPLDATPRSGARFWITTFARRKDQPLDVTC